MKKIGILGGTFDPIHNVHVLMARNALKEKKLSEVWVMPTFISPNKIEKKSVNFDKRYEMVCLALLDEKSIFPSDFELKRENISYTSDTVSLLKKEFSDTQFYLIIGGDSVMYLEKWHEPQLIFDSCNVLYAPRVGSSRELCRNHIENVLKKNFKNVNIEEINFILSDLSSTSIREKFRLGCRDYNELGLNPRVFEFIVKEKLYL